MIILQKQKINIIFSPAVHDVYELYRHVTSIQDHSLVSANFTVCFLGLYYAKVAIMHGACPKVCCLGGKVCCMTNTERVAFLIHPH